MCQENNLILINKQHPVSADYIPCYLVNVRIPFCHDAGSNRMLSYPAALNLELLYACARIYSMDICGISGYRSYEAQEAIYNASSSKEYVARPGESEHQSGLAIDLCSLEESFCETDEYRFLIKNAHRFGYILRYPKGKEDITGYPYEPWHFRYVGKDAASVIYEQGLCLEEFLSSHLQ